MEVQDRRTRRRARGMRPRVDGLEGRCLLSVTPQLVGGRPPAHLAPIQALAGAGGSGGGGGGAGGNTGAAAASPLLGQGQPTRGELARERFHGYFSGPITVGPGRFTDQAKTIYFRGLGGTNQFLHGDYQMAIVFPTDPTKPITGEAVLEDKNNNSSGIIGLQLTHDGTSFDRFGRPTHFTISADPNIYSGIFFNSTTSGTVDIHYSKSSATAIFNGHVYTSGLTNPTKNSDLYSRGGRVSP